VTIHTLPLVSPRTLHVPAYATTSISDSQSVVSPKSCPDNLKDACDSDIVKLVLSCQLKDHELEKKLDPFKAVDIRRKVVDYNLRNLGLSGALEQLPYEHDLDYGKVYGANCEIVVGYVPIPVGMVGPLTLNGQSVYVPMATTEGCLVASTNRGAKAITQGEGAYAVVTRDGITRAPCIRMTSVLEAAALKLYCEKIENFLALKAAFESTTSFGKLISCTPTLAGKNVYLRLTCFAGDAMGMNMVSKGSLAVIEVLKEKFPSLQLVALSGNMCTDKKAAAINWIEGRGKSVVVEATIPKDVVRSTLKTTVKAIVETNLHKNLIGSAMAGTIGGFNAHASNIVTAIFIACGQDPAQNVESSNCITLMEEDKNGHLWISCTMPSIEVGTVGGGTTLPAQSACLEAMGCRGSGLLPGANAKKLSMIVAAATMAGELSLLAALAANTLVAAHMQHNRKQPGSK
jgi:hydroxymethylglutaryl-CoA reductase (NADPH)